MGERQGYGRERHRFRLALAIVTATCYLAQAGCGGDDADDPTAAEQNAADVREALADASLPPEVVDLLALAAAGTEATYRIAYDLETTGGDMQRIELTQRPPDRRLDITAPGGIIDTTIATGGELHQCRFDTMWTCGETAGDAPLAAGGLDPAAVRSLADALAGGATRYDMTVERRGLLGVDATCLVTRLRDGIEPAENEGTEGTLCVSPEGAVLLADRPTGVLTAVEYGTDIDDDAFELPA